MQMIRDEQTHALAGEPRDRARLALIMGLPDWPAARAPRSMRRARMWRRNSRHCCSARRTRSGVMMMAGADWLDSEERRSTRNWRAAAFRAATFAAAVAALEAYRQRGDRIGGWTRRGSGGCTSSSIGLLKAAAARPQPRASCSACCACSKSIGTRSSYFALLKEQPAALDRLIEVCAISGFLSRQIADFPLLLDELIDAKAFDELPSRAGIRAAIGRPHRTAAGRRSGTAGRGVAPVSKGGGLSAWRSPT